MIFGSLGTLGFGWRWDIYGGDRMLWRAEPISTSVSKKSEPVADVGCSFMFRDKICWVMLANFWWSGSTYRMLPTSCDDLNLGGVISSLSIISTPLLAGPL